MSVFFITLYRFFSKNRIVFYLFLIAVIAFILFFTSRIRFEEDILRSMPNNGKADLSGFVIRNQKATDKLIINISLTDSSAAAEPDTLLEFGRKLVDSINLHFGQEYIRNITFQASDSAMISVMSMVSEHLPSFLDEPDYLVLDSLLHPETIKHSFERNYRMLISPGSMVLKKRILQDPLGITNLAFTKLASLQAGDEYIIYNGSVFTRDLKHLLIFLSPENSVNETSKNGELITGLGRSISQISDSGNRLVKAEYFGSIAVAVSNANQLKKDIALTLGLAILLIFILVGWYFRSIRVPFLGLLPAVFGGGLALTFLYLLNGRISAISLGIGSVILGLIVDYALYMINHFRRKGNIESVLREMSQTIVICSLTSAGAFLCLIFLESTVLHDLGWFAAISVLGAAFFALVILPQLLSEKSDRRSHTDRITWVDRFVSIRFEKNIYLGVAILILIITSIFFAGKVEFEKNMSTLSYVTPELSEAESNLDRISNYKFKNVFLVSTGSNAEEALRNKERLNAWIKELIQAGLVEKVSDAGPLLQSDSLQKSRITRWNSYWSPERKQAVKKYIDENTRTLHFKENAFAGFITLIDKTYCPLAHDDPAIMANPIVADWLTIKPEISMISEILKVKEENKPLLYKAFNKGEKYVMFDKQLLTDRFVASVKNDFDFLVLLSMIFVSLLLIISFGRIELGIMTALPMFLSWMITLGFMGLTGTRFNIFNIIISSFIFGLGVDYSILMMRGLQHDYKYGRNDLHSYKVSVFLSSATTLLGVGALLLARHPALNSIALIGVIGIITVVMLTYVVPPFLFNALILNRTKKGKFPVTARIIAKSFVTWGNIVAIAIILMFLGWIMHLLVPVQKKRKELWFHWIFSKLSKAYIAFTFAWARKLDNPNGEDFTTPGIIISNHQSLIETPAFLRLQPKIIILTTTWVHKSPVFGPIAHLANFSNVELGIDNIIGELQEKVNEGFSILIFPEGHRSADHSIQRFHRGAFYLSEKLKIDIIPVVVFGTGDFLPKNAFWGRPNNLFMRILPRVSWNDSAFGTDYGTRTKQFRKYYIREYARLRSTEGTADYYRRRLLLNYVYKGPIIEWYLRSKLRLEKNYQLICDLLPKKGEILDLGCGYGYISYMLAYTSVDRIITGVDYDADKIRVADNCFDKTGRLSFTCADAAEYNIVPQDGFLLSDLLHYLTPDKQEILLRRCIENLNKDGIILVREANTELVNRHKKSRITEFLSTNTGFNKTMDAGKQLFFTSAETIRIIANKYGMEMKVIDNKKLTSNNLFLITHLPHSTILPEKNHTVA